jgi:formylglycine-generating enzyme required for sulfatase activity
MSSFVLDQQRLKRMRAVAECPSEEFRALLNAGGIDPRSGLRNHDWSDLSFAGEDLRGLDFSRCKLHGCDFTGARIAGARFDQARLGAVLHDPGRDPTLPAMHSGIANLRNAADWTTYRDGWTRAPGPLLSDNHLSVGAIFQDAPFAPEMVVVPAGEFWMGSPDGSDGDRGHVAEPHEGPRHSVTIRQPFAVGRFAVTFEEWDWAQAHLEWRRHTKLEPRQPEDEKWRRDRRPVIDVSWEDAQAYCRWLTAVTGKPYQLPSEAEWEYCCRAGTETPFWWGASISTSQANYNTYGDGAKGENRRRAVPVDSFEANPWGLYQVHGNVWEWCQDEWHESYEEAPDDGSAWQSREEGGRRVLRGGSSNYVPQFLRSAFRYRFASDLRGGYFGFRVVRTLGS